MSQSYARGPQTPPLLEQTIGANLDETVARFGDREALVSCRQSLRYTWSELAAAVDEVARALIAAGRDGQGAHAPGPEQAAPLPRQPVRSDVMNGSGR